MIPHFLMIHGGLTRWGMSSVPGCCPGPALRHCMGAPPPPGSSCLRRRAQSAFKKRVEPSTSPQPVTTVAPALGWAAGLSCLPRLSVTADRPSSPRCSFLFCFTLFLSVSNLAAFRPSVLAAPAACPITSLCRTVNLLSPTG